MVLFGLRLTVLTDFSPRVGLLGSGAQSARSTQRNPKCDPETNSKQVRLRKIEKNFEDRVH